LVPAVDCDYDCEYDYERRTDSRSTMSEGPAGFTHLDEGGRARMVDVSAKAPTRRRALAAGRVRMRPQTLDAIRGGAVAKGDVLAVARVAGIQAAKQTAALIPLCHPLAVDDIRVDFELDGADAVSVRAEVTVTARTGAEMEALVAVSVAALTIYDMCKAADPAMVIEGIHLVEKEGGKRGLYKHPES
jgi:cyclic pyranopterin phosphate synthase